MADSAVGKCWKTFHMDYRTELIPDLQLMSFLEEAKLGYGFQLPKESNFDTIGLTHWLCTKNVSLKSGFKQVIFCSGSS